jgi:type I restriction enzyme M protein
VGRSKDANSYYQDEHNATGKFDFVMANPPFNAKGVDYDRLKDDKKRFPYGMPASDNANYLWIQMFYSALNSLGRAGFVMANSASDAGHSEQKIRKEMIEAGAVDVMVSISPNFFYTVTLPCSLWFFDKGKPEERKDKILFIDARNTFTQVTRAVREYSTEQLEFIANIARLYRGEKTEFSCENSLFEAAFPEGNYQDVKGLCKVATIEEVENQGWSLNPGRYVGAEDNQLSEKDFSERMVELKVEFSELSAKGDELTRSIKASLDKFQL